MTQKIVSTNHIANLLEVKASTVRKYVLILEAKGYIFLKNDKNQRLYTEDDITYFKQFKQLIDNNGMTLDDAATLVAERFISNEHGRDTARHNDGDMFSDQSEPTGTLEAKVDKLLDYIERQDERFEKQERFNRELLAKLEAQQKYISESIDKRDQQLMAALKESQEAKKLMLAAKEEEEERKASRGLFARLFGK